MSGPSNPPIYFKKLVLENIRCFSERQELILVDNDERPARWTLILGDNGVGKTTLLQCLARMRPVFNELPDEDHGPEPSPIEPKLASEDDNNAIKALVRSPGDIEARLEAHLSFGVSLSDTEQPNENDIITSVSIERTGDNITEFNHNGQFSGPNEKLDREPLVLAYGAGRHPNDTDQHIKGAVGKNNGTTDSVASLFAVEAPLCDAEDLLVQLEFYSMRKDQDAKNLLANLKSLLAEILPDIEKSDDIKILGPPSPIVPPSATGIQVTTSYGPVSIRQLSLGYQTMLAWTLDIALRLLKHFPTSPNPLLEPAIVIVDEIDLHLHPRWQRELREHLINHFPNIQFIATAHSPLMAQTALDNNLAVLKRIGNHAQTLNDPFVITGWRLDQIITSELFDLPSSRSPAVEKIMNRRLQLIEKKKLSEAEKVELRELDSEVTKLPTAMFREDHEAMATIRRAAEEIRRRSKEELESEGETS